MAWSLLNHMIADKVKELLDARKDDYPPEVKRFYSREQAEAIIHAALWGHSARETSDAGCYAAMNLFHTLGIKFWSFDQDETDAMQALRQKLQRERADAHARAEEG